jgi:hypothetical protein
LPAAERFSDVYLIPYKPLVLRLSDGAVGYSSSRLRYQWLVCNDMHVASSILMVRLSYASPTQRMLECRGVCVSADPPAPVPSRVG